MCSFLAYIEEKVNSKRFELRLAFIIHRGPDNSKIYTKKNFSFGFNRLAIQDLSNDSMQPMVDSFKNISLSNASLFLKINQNTLKNSILISKSKWEVRRQVWNFLALEFLIDQFVNRNDYSIQQQKIKSIIG